MVCRNGNAGEFRGNLLLAIEVVLLALQEFRGDSLGNLRISLGQHIEQRTRAPFLRNPQGCGRVIERFSGQRCTRRSIDDRHLCEGRSGFVVNVFGRRQKRRPRFIGPQTAGANRFDRLNRFAVGIQRVFAQLDCLVLFFLSGLQPQATRPAALRRPHQVQPLIVLRAVRCIAKQFRSVFVAPFL